MSVSDPLIKDIKGCVQQFLNLTNNGQKITDNNFYLILFCRTIEKIFDKGLITQQNTAYFNRTIDTYAWMISIVKSKNDSMTFAYVHSVDKVKERCDIGNQLGRFRLLVKYCLMKKCLHVPVEFLIKTNRTSLFYIENSIIGDEILSEIFLSVLLQISRIDFFLDLQNSSFLDLNWYIPDLLHLELVPCKNLGISVSFSGNRAIIVNVQPNSVTAENGNIKIGDVLDKLNGQHITASSKGRLSSILRSGKNRPVKVTIAKAFNKAAKDFYAPIQILLKQLNIDCDSVRKQYEDGDVKNVIQKSVSCGYEVKYLGSVNIGNLGTVKLIQRAIRGMCENYEDESLPVTRVDKKVCFEICEIGVKVKDIESAEVNLDDSYMKISACGNLPSLPSIFGYSVGDKSCDIATNFTCHIFEVGNYEDAEAILHSIAQGFHRTHFAV